MSEKSTSGMIDISLEPDFCLGNVTVMPSRLALLCHGTQHHVEYRVMQVLVVLYNNMEKTVSRDVLLTSCWGCGGSDEAINRCISQIRRIFRDTGYEDQIIITTVPKIGYIMELKDGPMISGVQTTLVSGGACW